MPAPSFNNSLASAGLDPAEVETGVITNVNVRNYTVDWTSQYTGKNIPDLQIQTPYLHYNNGEGFSCVPEIGAICTVCFPSDDDSPFIMGFLAAPELEGAEFGRDITAFLDDPGVETEEDVPKSQSTTSTGSTTTPNNVSDASYRAGRPVLNPGDMLWQGRDENFVVLRRGGVLQLGSTQICQRAYVPLLNIIRDFCENYELNSAAGTFAWSVQRQENDPGGNAPTELSIIAREFAQDAKASIKVLFGSLDDAEKPPADKDGGEGNKSFIEVTIAPQQISPDDGAISGTPKYVIRLDKAGNTFTMQAGTRTEVIEGDLKQTIKGSQDITVGGDCTTTIKGKQTVNVTGDQEVSGDAGSKETWAGNKSITAAVLKLGAEGASEPAVLGLKLISWLATHSHPPFGPPLQAGQVATLISKKVFVT